jgi:UDP-2,3-diacylglucosamine pyrophosphatase LpxH
MFSIATCKRETMRIIYAITAGILLILFTSCNSSETVAPPDSGPDPFSNGGNERNMIVVISDLHLGADLAYAEINENLKPLEKFLGHIRVAPNVLELVLAGDIFDEWFVPATTDTYGGKDQNDFMKRIAVANKGVIDAFNRIIQDGKISVTYVPGNHDLTITAQNVSAILPGINQARDPQQGLGTYSPAGYPQIAIEHGHRYNFFCAPDPFSNNHIAPGSILPPGYFYTRIATLHVVQNCQTTVDSILNVTQNQSGGDSQYLAYVYWNIWKKALLMYPIQNKFADKIIITNIDGFTAAYSVSDIIPYQLSPGGFINMNLYSGIQDNWNQRQVINNVAVNIPVLRAITNAGSAAETDNQAIEQYFMNPSSNKRIVVFGHTHVAAIIPSVDHTGQKTVYANSGTWIDHNPNKTEMNFIVITPQNTDVTSLTHVKLYNFEGGVVHSMAADSLRL